MVLIGQNPAPYGIHVTICNFVHIIRLTTNLMCVFLAGLDLHQHSKLISKGPRDATRSSWNRRFFSSEGVMVIGIATEPKGSSWQFALPSFQRVNSTRKAKFNRNYVSTNGCFGLGDLCSNSTSVWSKHWTTSSTWNQFQSWWTFECGSSHIHGHQLSSAYGLLATVQHHPSPGRNLCPKLPGERSLILPHSIHQRRKQNKQMWK